MSKQNVVWKKSNTEDYTNNFIHVKLQEKQNQAKLVSKLYQKTKVSITGKYIEALYCKYDQIHFGHTEAVNMYKTTS